MWRSVNWQAKVKRKHVKGRGRQTPADNPQSIFRDAKQYS